MIEVGAGGAEEAAVMMSVNGIVFCVRERVYVFQKMEWMMWLSLYVLLLYCSLQNGV